MFIRDLELQSTQDQLDRQVLVAGAAVRNQECLAHVYTAGCRLATDADFVDRVNNLVAPRLGGYRLLLLNSERQVVYDSNVNGASVFGQQIPIVKSSRVANVYEARASLAGDPYLGAAINISAAKRADPIGTVWVVLAQPQSAVATAAASDLAARLLEAGAAALVVAMLLALFVSRSITGPLTQLGAAAEDIATGNYSRRVDIKSPDEFGMLGSAFNRMAEAVERARKVQRDFLANVSHELKTPLTSLIGFSQALVDGSLRTDAERTRAATIVHEESERVLRMAQELLDLARVEAGSISMHITSVDLHGQLQQEMEMVRPRADARHLELKVSIADDVPPVAADPERLHQVLDNLFDNAAKYAADGSTVAVMARLSGGSVETIVANATGRHRPDPDRMFDRFYRADPARTSAAGGVGLGLAISRELATAMKGRLWADFDDTGNLRLHLLLPAARDHEQKAEPAVPAAVA
ncbi:MAG TPA: HAMP domain-containing sensor histidine kinase [Candidatus Dormibacteraeota bacterium]|nr:HAMP domain-containing sensor histidine kinase [Candidatus Dormibacteraeota bacterium]